MNLYSLWILACSFVVLFSCSFLIWPWYEGITGLLKWVWEYPFLINIFEEFHKDFHSFLFKYLVKLSETVWPMLFYVGKSLITESILLLICSNFLFLHDSVMVDCMFLRIYLFLLSYLIYWHVIVNSWPLWSFCISMISVINLLFHFKIYLSPLSFFPWWSSLKVCKFLNPLE